MAVDRLWGEAAVGATTEAQTAYEGFSKNYNGVFLLTLGLALIITVFEALFSKAGGGWMIVNYWIGWISLAAWAFFVFHPKGPGPVLLLAVMGFNLPWNEIDNLFTQLKIPDFKLKEMGEEGLKLLRTKYLVLAGHIALYLVMQSMVLATFSVTYAAVVPGILLGFVGFGLWAGLLTKAVVWYTRIVLLVLIATTGNAIVVAFALEPSKTEAIATETRAKSAENLDTRNAGQVDALQKFVASGGILSPVQQEWLDQKEAETARGPVKFVQDSYASATYRKDVIHTFTSLHDSMICDVMPGERTFRVNGNRVEVRAKNAMTGTEGTMSITEKLRFNGSALGQPTNVGKSTCVRVGIEGMSAAEKNALSISGGSIPFIIK